MLGATAQITDYASSYLITDYAPPKVFICVNAIYIKLTKSVHSPIFYPPIGSG